MTKLVSKKCDNFFMSSDRNLCFENLWIEEKVLLKLDYHLSRGGYLTSLHEQGVSKELLFSVNVRRKQESLSNL